MFQIDDHVAGNARRKAIAVESCTLGRGQFDVDAVIRQGDGIPAGLGSLATLVEAGGVAVVEPRGSADRHEQDVAVVRDTRATQVRVGKAVENVVGEVVARATVPAFQTGVGTELHHSEREGRRGVGVTVPASSDEGIDVARRIVPGGRDRGDEHCCGHGELDLSAPAHAAQSSAKCR